jgi:hypothetical protein
MSAPIDSIAAPPPALLEHRSYVAYWCARTVTNGAYQMQVVAVGWQIYELTGSASTSASSASCNSFRWWCWGC